MEQEALIRHASEQLFAQGNIEVITAVFSKAYVAHAGGKTYKGHDFLKRFFKQLRTALPDIRVTHIDILMQQEGTVAWQRSMAGTHKAGLGGIPASKKNITWNEMVVSRFEAGLIAEEWVVSELAGQLMINLPKAK